MTEPTFTTDSEKHVWDALQAQAPPEWTVLANLRLTTKDRDYEADLVVLIPDVGVMVVEVKGGTVHYDAAETQWWCESGVRRRKIHPIRQASEALYALREYVEHDPRWSRGRVRWSQAFVAPYTAFADDFETPECPRWAVHGRDDVDHLAGRLIAGAQKGDLPAPTASDCDLIEEILVGRSLPMRDVVALALEHEDAADRLTLEQANLLKVTRLLNRVEVRGGAGSGKTVLALTQAKELSRGSTDRPAQRVALVCYSIGLATHFKRVTATWPRRQQPAFVGTFEELGNHCGVIAVADRQDADFWEHGLPHAISDKARDLSDGKKFDSFVIDEAQDFADLWWQPIMSLLRDPDEGGLYVYSDENQRVFNRFGGPPVALVPLVLDRNLRNTQQIAESFKPLAPTRMIAGGGIGVDVELKACPADVAMDAGDDIVDEIMDEGWAPSDIALLTIGHRHPVQVELQERAGQDGYWDSFWDDDSVFYGHVLGCKGLERRVVVLVVNEEALPDGPRSRARERLYVGMSRATERLVVVGDSKAIDQIAGQNLTKNMRPRRAQDEQAHG